MKHPSLRGSDLHGKPPNDVFLTKNAYKNQISCKLYAFL